MGLWTTDRGARLELRGIKSEALIDIGVNGERPYLVLWDSKGLVRVAVSVEDTATTIQFYGKDKKLRGELLMNEAGGSKIKLYEEGGTLKWVAPR